MTYFVPYHSNEDEEGLVYTLYTMTYFGPYHSDMEDEEGFGLRAHLTLVEP
jgi:hypothetical protein